MARTRSKMAAAAFYGAPLLLLLPSSVHPWSLPATSHRSRPHTHQHRPHPPSPASAVSSPSNTALCAQTINEMTLTGLTGGGPPGAADVAFRHAMQVEKSGTFRQAAAAFHEAATLYRCFADHPDLFGHVTAYPRGDSVGKQGDNVHSGDDLSDVRSVLAYVCVRLAHLSHDALGDPKAASRLYREATATDPFPSSVSYDGVGTTLEAAGESFYEALPFYRQAHALAPGVGIVAFHLAVALERAGEDKEAAELLERLRRGGAGCASLVDSWGYVRWHMRKSEGSELNLHRGTRAMFELALSASKDLIADGGIVAEFGVASGRSTRMIQEMLPQDVPIHGFDTFTGLPQAWGSEPAGSYSTGGAIPDNMERNVFFHRGLFEDSIPPFLRGPAGEGRPLAFANIDCDLYSSTCDILESLHGRIVPGTVLVFDEYLCHPSWRQDEFRAWRESCKRFGWHYEYLAFSIASKQAVVQII